MFLISPEYYKIEKFKKRGRGVVALKDIPAGTVIGDYLGRLVDGDEAEKLERLDFAGDCYSLHYWGDLSVFPVDVKGVGVHLINNSCSNNCSTYFYCGHSLIFNVRKILAGEELTLDYLFDVENKEGYIHACHCGSPICRGTMYAPEEKLKAYGAFCSKLIEKYKFKKQKHGEVLLPLDNYPKLIKDDAYFDLYSNFEAKPELAREVVLPTIKELRRRLCLSGRPLTFTKLKYTVLGICDGLIIGRK